MYHSARSSTSQKQPLPHWHNPWADGPYCRKQAEISFSWNQLEELQGTSWGLAASNTTCTLHSHQHFYWNLLSLINAIMETTDSIVPKTKPSPYMKHCWTLELVQLRTETWWLGRKAYVKRKEPVDKAHQSTKWHATSMQIPSRNQKRPLGRFPWVNRWEDHLDSTQICISWGIWW